MTSCLCIGVLVLLADVAAWALTAQTGDSRWVVYITSGTTVVVALCAALIFLAPHVGKAIASLGESILPALAMIRKQNEELNKGTLSEKIETLMEQNTKLQRAVEDDRARTEDANRKLHEIRNEFNIATLQHREQRETLISEIGVLTKSLADARQEIAEFHRRESARLNAIDVGQVRQDVTITDHTARIEAVEESGAMPRVDGETG